MGKQKLGAFIRKIDYLKAKDGNDYEDSADNPCNQLLDVEHQCRDDMSFEDFKDAFAAFEEKICIKGFPERRTPAYDVAYSTGCVLTGLASSMDDDDEQLSAKMAAVMFHTLVALVKAGPCSTQTELMEKIRTHRSPDITEYAQTLGRQDLVPVMSAAKVTFKPLINQSEDADSYTSFNKDQLEFFFRMFTEEQCQQIQKEFLDTYIHYHQQIPDLPEEYGLQIYYLVRGMPENFENENPYWNLKDAAIIKSHLTVLKEMLLAKGYTSKNPTDQAAEMTMGKIVKAVVNDGYLEDVFDHMMSILIELHKNEKFRKQGQRIYKVYSYNVFRDLKEEQNVQHAKLYKGCVNLVAVFVSQGDLTTEPEQILKYALESVIESVKKVSPEDVKVTLTMINAMLGSGRQALIKKGESLLKHLKQIKALDWKKHIDDAKQLLATVAKIRKEDMQEDKGSDKSLRAYRSFMQAFREQLKKNKVLPQLQSCFVDFIFNCLVISPPEKAELAEEMAGRDFLDFSTEEKLRLVVLQKGEDVLKMDLPWKEDTDMIRTIGNVLRRVVDSYDENGKKVTEEENKVFMSIFKIVSEGGESVEEHFYQEEYEDRPNHRMQIWRDVLSGYVRLHQETATLSLIAPIMPEVLRWAKISWEEDHDDMMHLCYGILHSVGSGSTPTEFKTCLPEIVDLMLESGKFNELYSMVESLYPHFPKALHDRLLDIFNKMDDLKDNDRHIVTALLQTVSQKHPETFQQQHIAKLFEMHKEGNPASQPLILIIVRAIGEKHPKNLVEFLPTLCDDKLFKPDSMNLRSSIIAGIGAVNQKLGEKAIDYLMKYVDHLDPTVSHIVTGTASGMVRAHVEYMQKYKLKLEKLEETTTVPAVKDLVHNMILILEGKSIENIVDDIEQQKEDIADLDTKVDATMDTVITIGDKVIEHDKEIGELEEGLEKIEERVDDVEEEQEEAKIKIEEIDNKTMSNAPKWSRDLTKLMNPEADNDWRLLASRLGYSNDDIRGWATQHDPCMALLSEWYATHKTSEANYGVLTALVEMNRMDGASIVENAMKTAEGVVEDEEFEYSSPPPVFISYQWGFQNEVKLLKQHLNMAGYECWLDVGQMGGGDKLFAKIDSGIRGAKVVICCVTDKYAQSPNCNREVNLSVNLNKPIIPLLMEKMDWPPIGAMGPIFSEYLFIRFFQRGGEETPDNDQRYWPIPKFQELLMQLNFFVVPDEKMVQKEYARWWAPMVEDIVIDKNKGKKKESSQKSSQNDSSVIRSDESPLVFLSYQWGKQPQVKALYQRLTSMGYTIWMDIYQMGGGDSLYDKIDRGMRGCKAVVSCVTQKYSLSANCRREISLADALKKPIIPLLLEQIKWPPDGPMSMVFTELLYINFYREEAIQMTWKGDQFDELLVKLGQFVPVTDNQTVAIKAAGSDRSPRNTPAVKKEPTNTSRVKEKGDGTQKKEDETVGKPKSASKDKEVSKKDVDSVKFNSTNVSDKGADKRAIDKRVPSEKAGVGTTIQGSAGSAAGKQTRDTTSDVKSTGKTSTVQKSSAKKAVTVNAFGGSIVKDKVAQDIAAGKRSTTPKSAENSNNIAERKSSTNQISKAKSSDNEGDQKIIGKDTNKEPVKRPSFTDSKVRSKVTAVTAVSKGKVTKSANGTESESAKTNGTPGRGIPTASSKGTTAAKSASSVTSQNAGNKEKVGEEKSRSISQGTNKAGNTTSTPRQTNKATETKQTESDSKQVNGGVNEPKSKSCIIL